MSFVWKRPSLTVMEIAWRWLAAAPLLWLLYHALAPGVAAQPWDAPALQSMTFFEPVRSVTVLAGELGRYLPLLSRTASWWLPLAFLLWNAASTVGRTLTLQRADPGLRAHLARTLAQRLLRALAFLALLALWARALLAALHATITRPGALGQEPNLVLFTAEVVGLTLAAFMLWSLTVWAFDLPPFLAMTGLALAGPQRAHLRSKLIETNLVMGIVRVALFVLAMTFSASPLPFQSRETQGYINVWWTGVAIFYVVASDYFHVVRRVTYLRLLEAVIPEANATRSAAS